MVLGAITLFNFARVSLDAPRHYLIAQVILGVL
jgi:hypothetical protein